MMDWRPFDARDRDPEVRKERVKLLSAGANAVGLAFIIGSLVAPFVDAGRSMDIVKIVLGAVLGVALILFALWIMRYIKAKEN